MQWVHFALYLTCTLSPLALSSSAFIVFGIVVWDFCCIPTHDQFSSFEEGGKTFVGRIEKIVEKSLAAQWTMAVIYWARQCVRSTLVQMDGLNEWTWCVCTGRDCFPERKSSLSGCASPISNKDWTTEKEIAEAAGPQPADSSFYRFRRDIIFSPRRRIWKTIYIRPSRFLWVRPSTSSSGIRRKVAVFFSSLTTPNPSRNIEEQMERKETTRARTVFFRYCVYICDKVKCFFHHIEFHRVFFFPFWPRRLGLLCLLP